MDGGDNNNGQEGAALLTSRNNANAGRAHAETSFG